MIEMMLVMLLPLESQKCGATATRTRALVITKQQYLLELKSCPDTVSVDHTHICYYGGGNREYMGVFGKKINIMRGSLLCFLELE